MKNERLILLAHLGVFNGPGEQSIHIMKIDLPEAFKMSWSLDFTPPTLQNDKQAEEILFNYLDNLLQGKEEEIKNAALIYEGFNNNTVKTKFFNYWVECHSVFGKDETSGESVTVYTAQTDIEYLLSQYKAITA